MEHIRRIAKAMDRVVDCIPARYYLANEPAWQQLPGVDDATPTSQVIQRLARAAGKQKKGKKKLGKQMQAENPNLVRKGNDKRKKKDASSSLASNGKEVEEGEDHVDPMADYESLDLRGKLQAKIASLRQQRKDQQRARDLERKRERQGSAGAQQAGAVNMKKQKDHRDGHTAEKKSKGKTAAEALSAEPTAEGANKASEAGARAAATEDAGTSSLEFGNVGVAKQTLDTSYHQPLKGSKWKRIDKTLRDQERKDKKLDKLPEDEKQKLIHDQRMEKAMLRATGEKVKDDKSKLKKTVKKHDHKMANKSGGGGAGGVSASAAGAAGAGGKGSGGKQSGKGSGGKGGKGGKEKGSGKGGGKEKGSGKGSFGKGKGKRKHGFEGGGRRVLNSDKDL